MDGKAELGERLAALWAALGDSACAKFALDFLRDAAEALEIDTVRDIMEGKVTG